MRFLLFQLSLQLQFVMLFYLFLDVRTLNSMLGIVNSRNFVFYEKLLECLVELSTGQFWQLEPELLVVDV